MELIGPFLSIFGVIFAIIDPFGYIPIFIAMTKDDSAERRRQMLVRACSTSTIILILFTLVGNPLLKFLGISIPALQISGGLILLVIGFEMLQMLPIGAKLSPAEENEGVRKDDISIVPLAIPMLSGPASITTVVVLGSRASGFMQYAMILSSILLTLGVTFFILKFANSIQRGVGVTGLNVMTRIMGLLLCAMAIQFIINGYSMIQKGA